MAVSSAFLGWGLSPISGKGNLERLCALPVSLPVEQSQDWPGILRASLAVI